MNIGIIAQAADIRHWIASHAEILAPEQPAWADPARTWVDLDFAGEEAASVLFRGDIAGVELSQWFAVEDQGLKPKREPRIGTVPSGHIDTLTLAELHRLSTVAGRSVSETYEMFSAAA